MPVFNGPADSFVYKGKVYPRGSSVNIPANEAEHHRAHAGVLWGDDTGTPTEPPIDELVVTDEKGDPTPASELKKGHR